MSKEIQAAPSVESLEALRSMFPTEPGFTRRSFSRLALVSQDKTEGKGKAMKVIAEAGTFFIERESGEVDPDTGKKVWTKEELGTSIEGVVVFNRKQLSFFDSGDETYTSSPIYDTDDEVVPLFKSGAEIARGIPKDLQALYPAVTRKGKPSSDLKDNAIVYVLYEDELYQMNLHGTSMYAYRTYKRSTPQGINTVLTRFSSEPKEMGSTNWNQMTFTPVRSLTQPEVNDVLSRASELTNAIAEEKSFFASRNAEVSTSVDPLAGEFDSQDLPQLN